MVVEYRERLYAMSLSFVRLSPKYLHKTRFSKKTKQFRAMVSIDDPQKVLHGLFKEPIIGPLKFKVADIRHLENRHVAISQR